MGDMNDHDKAVMYRWLAAVLALAVVVLLILWYGARSDVEEATERFQGDLSFYRQEIIKTCTFTSTTTDADRALCEDVLESFSDMLRDYRNLLIDRTGTSTAPTSTLQVATSTSPTTTATTSID